MSRGTGIEVVDNSERCRYEVWVDGVRAGLAAYRRHGGVITVDHTEVDPERQGQGLASALAAGVLADVRRRALRIRPLCPFIASYLARHPEHDDLLAPTPGSSAVADRVPDQGV